MVGGGGAIAATLTSLKNNSRRSQRKAYDGWRESDKESQGIKIEPVSEEVLQEIRIKLKNRILKKDLNLFWFF